MKFKTEQEKFWAGEFGNEYLLKWAKFLASNLHFFSKAFNQLGSPNSLIEFGANVEWIWERLSYYFNIELSGVEINKTASEELVDFLEEKMYSSSIFDYQPTAKFDVSLIKAVLIHIDQKCFQLFMKSSINQVINISEYYNPSPITVNYRGHNDRLFKRDFAGELLETYDDLELIDYGFIYKRDKAFPLDDFTWFLIKKVKDHNNV